MDMKLMQDFEELEGLVDGAEGALNDNDLDDQDDDDPSMKPANAMSLDINDLSYELERRNLKQSGFPDKDRETLQKAFEDEFVRELEELRAKRKESRRRAAQQAGLARRRKLMEKTLQEEQDELSREMSVSLLIDLVKENMVHGVLRINVSSISARSLAKALWVNDSVTSLDLSSNNLSDHAGSYLARILKRNKTVLKLELDNNSMGPSSCRAFAEALRYNNSLQSLSLDSNPLTQSTAGSNGNGSSSTDQNGFLQFAEVLKSNKSLTSLNLWRTGLSAHCGNVLADCLEENDKILFLDVGHNPVDMSDQKRISEKLDNNLREFERRERDRRREEQKDSERMAKIREREESDQKARDLATWLDVQRESRAELRRVEEEERVARVKKEEEERRKAMEEQRERERKAAEEAEAKKKKKAEKAKKK